MAAPRRRRIVRRRRVEDEGDDDGRAEALDLDDDSNTDGSLLTEDDDVGEGSDTSNIEAASPKVPGPCKTANGTSNVHASQPTISSSDTDLMLRGLSLDAKTSPARDTHFDETTVPPPKSSSGPVIVSSTLVNRPQPAVQAENRQEHEDYKRRRDEDPAFVPNRGSFFMHDHRHAGPAANGFRPFGRGRGRGGRGGFSAPYAPLNRMPHPSDPTTNSPWTHDMHHTVVDPPPRRPRQMHHAEVPSNGNGFIPTCEPSSAPINRTLSTEKHVGNAQVRVFLPHLLKSPAVFIGMPVKQYTKLPDHRPPLRRDKPVRISLPQHSPRYIYPAPDRSFTFIPRALRPNQQRMRGRPRSAWGSVSAFSRRTSVIGGSFYGSVYSPSVALSRRSSVVHDHDPAFSPTSSVMSRPPMVTDVSRPIVRLPPVPQPECPPPGPMVNPVRSFEPAMATESSINHLPPPQMHPLPQKPVLHQTHPSSLPIHQPRPQKNISVADIESPTMSGLHGPPFPQQPFHQQMPAQVVDGPVSDAHALARRFSHPSQHSTGTPLSQIPERAIHAPPFQPNSYGQPYFGPQQAFQPPPPAQAQQGFFYGPSFPGPGMAAPAAASPFVPGSQHVVPGNFAPQHRQTEQATARGVAGPSTTSTPNLVAQEVNGMVYYYDASQIQQVNTYPPYSAPQAFQPSVMGMGGMVTPSPDGFYYPPHVPGMVYYSQ